MNGIQARPSTTKVTVVICPTRTSLRSDACGLNFLYKSQVIKVEQELKTEERELISAAKIPAIINPLKPTGRTSRTMAGNVLLGWSTVSIPFWTSAKATTPGKTKIKSGNIFRNPAKIVPLRALLISLAASTRWTIN